jgi:hypothetical protein
MVNYIALLYDLSVEQGLPAATYTPFSHPLPGHVAVLCQYGNVNAVGSGLNVIDAKKDAARGVWMRLGHVIDKDPTYDITVFDQSCVGFALHIYTHYK